MSFEVFFEIVSAVYLIGSLFAFVAAIYFLWGSSAYDYNAYLTIALSAVLSWAGFEVTIYAIEKYGRYKECFERGKCGDVYIK